MVLSLYYDYDIIVIWIYLIILSQNWHFISELWFSMPFQFVNLDILTQLI